MILCANQNGTTPRGNQNKNQANQMNEPTNDSTSAAFWRKQAERINQRNQDLYKELEELNAKADNLTLALFALAVAFIVSIAAHLL